MNTANTLLDIKEAAEQLRLSRATLAKYRMKNIGPSYLKLGSRVYYRQIDLEQWIASNVVTTRCAEL